jgi:hypothetical protein
MNMKHQKQLATALLLAAACSLQAQRSETLLEKEIQQRRYQRGQSAGV